MLLLKQSGARQDWERVKTTTPHNQLTDGRKI